MTVLTLAVQDPTVPGVGMEHREEPAVRRYSGHFLETKVLLAALTWLEHDYQNRKQFEDTVLACVRFGLLPESVLLKCFEAPPLGKMALSGRPVRMQLMEAAFSHYVRLRGRPDLALEVRKRTFTAAVPASLSESTVMTSPSSDGSPGVGSPTATKCPPQASDHFIP
ncbi:hypothetical protein HPB51_006702 [Rhipicephalus microplus]|uniref:BACK domain-containing protein n=1 Tax=Rhipicephalus microplus TaxID=6941 RepID=A0A9J6E7F5_RHIMP|nr:hypothetical protein HPB51_006702 [Rhipicephalus microplus]